MFSRLMIHSRSLGLRFLLSLLLLGFFFSLIETGIHLFIEYRSDIGFVNHQIRQVEESYLKSLVKSTWDMEAGDVTMLLEGALQLRDIRFLEVRTETGEILASAGMIPDGPRIEKTLAMDYFHFGKTHRVGYLFMAAGLEAVYQRLYDRALVILSSRAVRTFFTSLFILGIFHYLVSRHLGTMADYTRNLDLDHLDLPLSLNRKPLRDKAGKPDELDQVVIAVNEMRLRMQNEIRVRKEAEIQILQLRHYLSSIIDSMPSVLAGVSPDGIITQWNREAEKRTRIPHDQACGRLLAEVAPDMAGFIPRIREAIQTGQPLDETRTVLAGKDRILYENITVYPLTGDGANGAVIRIDDVTEKVRIEEMMIQSEKMMSIGGLAAGMAHEINNPLAGIMGNAQMLRQRLTAASEANLRAAAECSLDFEILSRFLEKRGILNMMDNIEASSARAARIVRNMLSFSRKSAREFKAADLAEIMDTTLELAASDYRIHRDFDFKKISITKDYAPDLPAVFCEPGEIQQVFFNLIQNAADALSEQTQPDTPPCVTIRMNPNQDHVVVEIQDNGPGMAESVRKRIFEPFFTTKRAGSGTGLGLSVSYFIITEQHGGEMEAISSPETGTRLIIRLPVRGGKHLAKSTRPVVSKKI